ncbi:magnesium ion transporter [Rhizophlyctis rosea]|nr:magnesium ion transporter [Rhizophlyctis rosea]
MSLPVLLRATRSRASRPSPIHRWSQVRGGATAGGISGLKANTTDLPLPFTPNAIAAPVDGTHKDPALFPIPGTKLETGNERTANASKLNIKLKAKVFSTRGALKVQEGEWSKAEICAIHELQPRDLRRMDSSFAEKLPAILVRQKAFLVNLLEIKALIRADMAIFVEVRNESNYSDEFIAFVQEKIREGDGYFEFKVLEAILYDVIVTLETEQAQLIPPIQSLLKNLDERISEESLKDLLEARRAVSTFGQKVDAIRTSIAAMLENDEDLAGLYLTEKAAGRPRKIEDHMEAELLFEHYMNLADDISNNVAQISSDIASTQAILNIILDSQRNRLIIYELKATLATAGLTAGAMIASLFGMNLTSGVESQPGLFWSVAGGSVFLAAGIFWGALRGMKRLGSLSVAERWRQRYGAEEVPAGRIVGLRSCPRPEAGNKRRS